MIFIVGTGRCGTKSMAEFFDRVPGATGHHEPQPLLFDEVVAFARGTMARTEMAAKLWRTREGRDAAEEYVESNNLYAYAIPALLTAFPQARIVWLTRDGRNVVASLMRNGWFTNERQAQADASGNWPLLRFGMDWFHAMSRQQWRELTEFERCCWYWAKTNSVIECDLADCPGGRKLLLPIERVQGQMHDLERVSGLRIPASLKVPVLNQARSGGHSWSTWSEEQRTTFYRVCGSVMGRLYPNWRDASGEWQSLEAFTKTVRTQLWLQRCARRVVFDQNPLSRAMYSLGRRVLGARDKAVLKRFLGM